MRKTIHLSLKFIKEQELFISNSQKNIKHSKSQSSMVWFQLKVKIPFKSNHRKKTGANSGSSFDYLETSSLAVIILGKILITMSQKT